MPGFDIYKMDQEWARRQEAAHAAEIEAAKKAEEAAAAAKAEEEARQAGEHGGSGGSGTSQAEETADNAIGDTSREAVIRQQMAEGQASPEVEMPEPEPETDALKLSRMPAYQARAARIMANSLTLKNAQKVVAISTRENIRKGLAKGQMQPQKPGRGTQTSTVAIPTALLRYVQQEIGSTRLKLNQNDAMAGFLYWYFGLPDDVAFQDEASYEKALDAAESLKANASPARMGQLNYNLSASLLDKLEVMSERLDGIAGTLGLVKNDGSELKLRSDKSYIAICYLLLNYLGFAPLVAPGQRPSDLDLMVGGLAWDLMAGVDDALDWLRTTDGREKYKAKHGQRPSKPMYQPAAPPSSPDGWTPAAPHPAPVQQPDDDDDDDGGWDAYLDSEEDEEGYSDVDDLGEDMDDFLEDVEPDYDTSADDPDAETAKEAKRGDLSAIMQEAARNKRAAAIAEVSMRKQQARQNNN